MIGVMSIDCSLPISARNDTDGKIQHIFGCLSAAVSGSMVGVGDETGGADPGGEGDYGAAD
jgi:hypothetical protein